MRICNVKHLQFCTMYLMFIFIFVESTCFYDILEYPAKDPGKPLGPFLSRRKFHFCEEECEKNPRCNNIKVCDNGCTLFDKPLFQHAEAEPNRVDPNNCFTAFKTCPGGKFRITTLLNSLNQQKKLPSKMMFSINCLLLNKHKI